MRTLYYYKKLDIYNIRIVKQGYHKYSEINHHFKLTLKDDIK